jgi:hypothetical protein
MSDQNPPVVTDPMDDPARILFRWLIRVLVVIALVMLASNFLAAVLKAIALEQRREPGFDSALLSASADTLTVFNVFLNKFIEQFWGFIAPLLSIAVLLLIVDWFLRRLGIRFTGTTGLSNINVQAAIALLVIGSLALASFVSKETAEPLKELSLVVVGFYFGSRNRQEATT